MIAIQLIPVATATSQELLIEFKERFCQALEIANIERGTAVVNFIQAGATRVINGAAVATIVATLTVTVPVGTCGCAKPYVFTETFDVAFSATGTNTIALAPGVLNLKDPIWLAKCGKAGGVKVTTTLTATIA